mgnify:CR=1 FL=1|tara:strand:+ start:2916 stop:3191 length:276 start_codon:yes stop_codon:yes gene_type:complete
MEKLTRMLFATLAIVIFFTMVFTLFDHTHWNGLNNDNDTKPQDKFFNRLYFTMTTFSSTGYGDISPGSKEARIAVMFVQLLLTVAILDYIV